MAARLNARQGAGNNFGVASSRTACLSDGVQRGTWTAAVVFFEAAREMPDTLSRGHGGGCRGGMVHPEKTWGDSSWIAGQGAMGASGPPGNAGRAVAGADCSAPPQTAAAQQVTENLCTHLTCLLVPRPFAWSGWSTTLALWCPLTSRKDHLVLT